jgi:hypothetical protein
MFHSTVISEPAALTTGVLGGLIAYALLAGSGAGHEAQIWGAILTSVAVNFFVGVPINAAMLDILSLLLIRPLSAYVGAHVVSSILS